MKRFLRHREESVFRKLYQRYTPRLYRIALRVAATSGSDAEEAVQETWSRAIERLDTFAWRSSLATWLTGITLNVCREHERRGRSGPLPPDELSATTADVGSNPGSLESRIWIERAIASLPAGYRRVLVLHDIEGYTHQQIADALGIDPGTSKSQLSRARQALRGKLRGEPRSGVMPSGKREP